MTTTFSGKDQMSAAQKAWDTLSSHFANNIPRFGFTLQSGGSCHHFEVCEKINKSKSVDYTLNELEVSGTACKKMKTNLANRNKQQGGKKHKDDDDSSSTSDDDLYTEIYMNNILRKSPIYYWYYDPVVYSFDSYYIPTFVAPLTPYVEIAYY